MIFKGKAKNGRMYADDKDMMSKCLTELEDKDIFITIEDADKVSRSVLLNRVYFGLLGCAVKYLQNLGNQNINRAKLHGYFKTLYLSDMMVSPVSGAYVPFTGSTRDLTNKKFQEYMGKVSRHMIEDIQIEADVLQPYIDMVND